MNPWGRPEEVADRTRAVEAWKSVSSARPSREAWGDEPRWQRELDALRANPEALRLLVAATVVPARQGEFLAWLGSVFNADWFAAASLAGHPLRTQMVGGLFAFDALECTIGGLLHAFVSLGIQRVGPESTYPERLRTPREFCSALFELETLANLATSGFGIRPHYPTTAGKDVEAAVFQEGWKGLVECKVLESSEKFQRTTKKLLTLGMTQNLEGAVSFKVFPEDEDLEAAQRLLADGVFEHDCDKFEIRVRPCLGGCLNVSSPPAVQGRMRSTLRNTYKKFKGREEHTTLIVEVANLLEREDAYREASSLLSKSKKYSDVDQIILLTRLQRMTIGVLANPMLGTRSSGAGPGYDYEAYYLRNPRSCPDRALSVTERGRYSLQAWAN